MPLRKQGLSLAILSIQGSSSRLFPENQELGQRNVPGTPLGQTGKAEVDLKHPINNLSCWGCQARPELKRLQQDRATFPRYLSQPD